ncbi:MAG: hypothetical protein WCG73_02775 [Candidatus Moraniibacteriota bacterium]
MFNLPPVPAHLNRYYHIARIFLYVIILSGTVYFFLQTFFPTLSFSYNFRVSNSGNTLLDPHSLKNVPATNGKIGKNESLIISAGVLGKFSQALVSLNLEKKSEIPNTLGVTIKRSYRSFFLPTGTPITGFPPETLYHVDNTYYALRNNVLYPFVSDSAYLSRYPSEKATSENADFLKNYTISESWIGYRVGSMLSFADGVFLITSETDMRPIGNAETLLALGYRFEDVRPASEEEIGIYKRGRIILVGVQHPDGTLLLDHDTNTYYLIENNFKRPILDENYRDFIAKQQAPIVVSSEKSNVQVNCTLEPSLLFSRSFSCQTPISLLESGFGNDFEITIGKNNTDIDVNTLGVSFETEKSKKNMMTILSQIKQQFLSRFGIGNK